MQLLDRYIRRTILMSIGLAVIVLLGIESFLELVQQFGDIGKGHYGMLQVAMFVPLQLPTDLYQLFPTAGFIGCLIGLGRLAESLELTVMRAAGISVGRIAWSVIKTAIVLIVFVTLMGEAVAPWLQRQADHIKFHAMGQAVGFQSIPGVWLKSKNNYIHIGSVESAQSIKDILIYTFKDQQELQSAAIAKAGVRTGYGSWQLSNINKTLFLPGRTIHEHQESMVLPALFVPKFFLNMDTVFSDQPSVYQLITTIAYKEKSGLVISDLQFKLWQRIMQPINSVLMILLGIPFIFGSLRTTRIGTKILMGVVIGFGFYMLDRFSSPIVTVFQIQPYWVALVPTIIFVFVYLAMLKRV